MLAWSDVLQLTKLMAVPHTFYHDELGPQNHTKDGLSGPHSIIVVYMDPKP